MTIITVITITTITITIITIIIIIIKTSSATQGDPLRLRQVGIVAGQRRLRQSAGGRIVKDSSLGVE